MNYQPVYKVVQYNPEFLEYVVSKQLSLIQKINEMDDGLPLPQVAPSPLAYLLPVVGGVIGGIIGALLSVLILLSI